MIKMQALFDVDLPTSVEMRMEESFPAEEGVRQEVRLTGKQLMQRCPQIMHWLVANNYAEFDLIITVGEKQDEEVGQSVAQYPPM